MVVWYLIGLIDFLLKNVVFTFDFYIGVKMTPQRVVVALPPCTTDLRSQVQDLFKENCRINTTEVSFVSQVLGSLYRCKNWTLSPNDYLVHCFIDHEITVRIQKNSILH